MPDFSQSTPGLEPATVVDHILLPVADLELGAQQVREKVGLQAIPGGPHASGGTANFIVPLGLQYLELIAVVDEKAAVDSRLGLRVMQSVKRGRTFVAWALRTADLDALRQKLLDAGWDLPPIVEGSRRRPDGQVLSWRTQDIVTGPDASAIPFVIEWNVPEGLHPGQAEAAHPLGVASIKRVVVGAQDPDHVRSQLETLLGKSDFYEVRWADADGVDAIVIEHPNGSTVLR